MLLVNTKIFHNLLFSFYVELFHFPQMIIYYNIHNLPLLDTIKIFQIMVFFCDISKIPIFAENFNIFKLPFFRLSYH